MVAGGAVRGEAVDYPNPRHGARIEGEPRSAGRASGAGVGKATVFLHEIEADELLPLLPEWHQAAPKARRWVA